MGCVSLEILGDVENSGLREEDRMKERNVKRGKRERMLKAWLVLIMDQVCSE